MAEAELSREPACASSPVTGRGPIGGRRDGLQICNRFGADPCFRGSHLALSPESGLLRKHGLQNAHPEPEADVPSGLEGGCEAPPAAPAQPGTADPNASQLSSLAESLASWCCVNDPQLLSGTPVRP